MSELNVHGVTPDTPENIMLSAGAVYVGLEWDDTAKAWKGEPFCATSGGNKFSIKPNLKDVELDGVSVKAVGLTVKQGGTATLTVNAAEIKEDVIKAAVIAEKGVSAGDFACLQDKPALEKGDYLSNLAFVGRTLANRRIIVLLERALCTSGLEGEGKKDDASVFELTFEAYADIEDITAGKDLDTIPWKIYYPESAEAEGEGE